MLRDKRLRCLFLDVCTLEMSSGLGIRAETLAFTVNLLLPNKTLPAEWNTGCIILVRQLGLQLTLAITTCCSFIAVEKDQQ